MSDSVPAGVVKDNETRLLPNFVKKRAIAFDNTTAVTANLCNSGSESNGCSGINMDEASQGECYQQCPG